MSLKDRLNDDMKAAMKAKDADRLGTIRLVRSAVKNKEIDLGHELDDTAVLAVLSTLVKQRRESAEVYRNNGRDDMAAREEAEIAVLQDYLPQPLTAEELAVIVDAAVTAVGATGLKDMGAVMQRVMAQTTGRADGKQVNQLVRQRLGG